MSIRLNKETNEKEGIKQLIKQSILNPNYELECIMGGHYNHKLSFTQFNKVLSRVSGKKEYTPRRPADRLDITFPKDSRYRNLRVSIHGATAVNYYCMNDKLDSILNNVSFETKELVKEKVSRVPVPAYNIRFNQKAETPVDKETALIRDLLRDWKELPKEFRYKTIYRYETADGWFSIDCSVVRASGSEQRELTVEEVLARDLFTSVKMPADEKLTFSEWWKRTSKNPKAKVMVRAVGLYFKNLKESQLFDNPHQYEIEIEFIGNKITDGDGKQNYMFRHQYSDEKEAVIDRVFAGLFRQVGLVLQCVQDSFYLMSNDDMYKVSQQYYRLTGKHRGTTDLFFGPLPVDLDKNKCIQLPDNVYNDMNRVYDVGNILIDYCVTDKSDGIRHLMFIDKDGDCYLIGRDSISPMKSVGVKIPDWANSIWDGEYLEHGTSGEYLNKYLIFDAYWVKGEYHMDKEFGDGRAPNTRYSAMLAFTEQFRAGRGVQMVSDKLPFLVDKKTFLFGELSTTPMAKRNYNLIFDQSAKLLAKMNKDYGGMLTEGNLYSYKTDGLIFTPVRLAVFQTRPDIEHVKHVESGTWAQCYKWKPSQFLTIDFKVSFLKDASGGRKTIYYNSTKYVYAELKCMNYHSQMNRSGTENKYDTNLNALMLNDGIDLSGQPLEMPFMATYPYMGVRDAEGDLVMTVSQCLLPINERGEVHSEEGELLFDGDTVEFRYLSPENKELTPAERESIQNDAQRWRPMRVRRGKRPNKLKVCLDIWSLIHTPVTVQNVTRGITVEESNELNYYLSTKADLITDTMGLNKFNGFCKGHVLNKYLATQSAPKVFDLGCGKMGDYMRYVLSGVKTLVGMDLSHDNLNNSVDGAATRILQNVNKSAAYKALAERTLLISGSFTLPLANGDAGADMLAKYYLDILYGRHKPSNPKHAKFFNMGVDGFNCVTSMYVIHYAFGNEKDLDTYLENVSGSLKEQGYFIGTCLDGPAILSELNAADGYLEGKVGDQTVWIVEQKTLGEGEGQGDALDENMAVVPFTKSPHVLGVGNRVNIYYETINKLSMENLVDIKYLEYKAKAVGLKLIETRLYTEDPGSLLTEFLSSDVRDAKTYVENIKNEPALNQWANWQRYFVFQKTG